MQNLTRGQKLKLADLTSGTFLGVGLSAVAPGLSFDISCFGVDVNNQLSDDRYFVFYNQKSSPEGALRQMGAQGGDNETFAVELAQLPPQIKRLVFTLTLDGNGTMSQMQQGHVRFVAGGQELARFAFSGRDFELEKAVIAAEIYFKDVWRIAAVGQGFAGGLGALLKHFGGEEVSPSAAPVAQPPIPSTPPVPSGYPPPVPPPAPPLPPVGYPQSAPLRPAPPVPVPPPAAPPKLNLNKITLDKQGEKSAVSLKKNGAPQPIHINLNWDNPNAGLYGGSNAAAPDLDLGCMFRLKNGRASVIQPLGGNFGARDQEPYILLDKDDRSGAAQDGENLIIYRPDLIDTVMVFAMIYQGAPNFVSVNGRLTLRDQDGNEIFIRLNNPDRQHAFCCICTIRNTGNAIEITKEERYVPGHREADQQFGFGFRWTAGSK